MLYEDFYRRYNDLRLAGKTHKALELILVYGMTWARAAGTTGVHQSTIARALRRHPPFAPQAQRAGDPPHPR
jgi:hypothetical protein